MNSETIHNELQTHVNGLLARQTPHPVRPAMEVLWDQGFNITELCVRTGPLIERLSPKELVQRIAQRERLLVNEKRDPIRYLCEPEEYRRIDLEMVRKRLRNPGVQLTLWVNGGIRSSKTEFTTRRLSANFWYPVGSEYRQHHQKEAWVWAFHQTDDTSRTVHQRRVYKFIPFELKSADGKEKKALDTKFNYTKAGGFTGSQFQLNWHAHNERGCLNPTPCRKERPCANAIMGGGLFEFRFYGQDTGTMVGQEITCCASDEKIPANIIDLIDDRLLTRSADTRTHEFLLRMEEAERILLAGGSLPLPLLGAVYHGVHLISYTPKDGWTPACAKLLLGAVKRDFYDPKPMVEVAMREKVASLPAHLRIHQEAEFAQQPWTLNGVEKVPRFADPQDQRKLVSYMPTYANAFEGNWPGAVQSVQGKSREQTLITLFGDVGRNVESLLGFEPERHIREEAALPMGGTIYESADPSPKKPWVIKWYVVDALGRKWVVQEWPCTTWAVEGHGLPGAWAVPSDGDKMNGDPGPAQQLKVSRDWKAYTRLIWQGRARLAQRLRAVHGEALRVRTEQRQLNWEGLPHFQLEGEFVTVETSIMDSRFAEAPTLSRAGTNSTPLEEMLSTENALNWIKASGVQEEHGLMLMQADLSADILGLPGMMVMKECTNTIFAWATYTHPEHAEHAPKKDEACKDFVDPDRYFVLEGPEDTENIQLTS